MNEANRRTVAFDRNDIDAAVDNLDQATKAALDALILFCPGGSSADDINDVIRLVHGARDILVRATEGGAS
jgi:hypothetical protein